ncbi:hypothetical protein CDAR_122011 [Caerostris darwini]|uniref:Secreted protein n=1 Tax=Caerostris darwini TaxID=1538125 RepID=A0AAV4PRJ0_9ARAC|nr:hypothetical protein CDAR_122011 [Caerostris darwini]
MCVLLLPVDWRVLRAHTVRATGFSKCSPGTYAVIRTASVRTGYQLFPMLQRCRDMNETVVFDPSETTTFDTDHNGLDFSRHHDRTCPHWSAANI